MPAPTATATQSPTDAPSPEGVARALLDDPGPAARPWSAGPALAVTIQDVEPRTYRRVSEIRAWLAQHGVDRVTLAVIPAADLHPVGTRSPILAAWLRAQVARGDAIAQHGLQHHGRGPEFAHLGAEESASRVHSGLAMLREVELDPHGFIAPAYGYTPALRAVVSESFDWFGERNRVRGAGHSLHAPTLGLGTATRAMRLLSPTLARGRMPLVGVLMRLDIHPGDFDLRGHVDTIAAILGRGAERQVVTYDDVFCPRG